MTCILTLTILGLLAFVTPVAAVNAAETPEPIARQPHLCLPDSTGEGWVCEEYTPHRATPSMRQSTMADRSDSVNDLSTRKTSPEQQEAVAAQTMASVKQMGQAVTDSSGASSKQDNTIDTAANVDRLTSLSADPEARYEARAPRPAEVDYQLQPDLASAYYERDMQVGRCSGGYRVRTYPQPVGTSHTDYPVDAEADSLTSIVDVSVSLQGNVSIEQGNRLIVAPKADLDQTRMIASFPEGVRMDQPGLVMQGPHAEVNLRSNEAAITDAQFLMVEAGLRGNADAVEQNADGDLNLVNNGFTRCEPGNDGWQLNTDSLVIEKNAVFGTARGAVLRMKSFPVFYTPYLKFPVSDDRVSGFLFPNLGYSDEDGVDLSVPYYFNLAPNYDATVVPRYIGDRGAGVEAEIRHLSSWQSTAVAGSFLPKDDLFNGRIDKDDFNNLGGEAVFGSFDPADRWLGSIEHRGFLGPVRTLVDYTAVSDRDYFRDLGSDLGLSSRRELERKAELQYSNDDLFVRLWAQRFQRLDEVRREEYQRIPELEMTWRRPLVGPLEFSLGAKWSEFDRKTDGLNGLAAMTGSRLHLEPRLRVPFAWPFGFLSFGGGFRHTSYDLEQDPLAGGIQLIDENPDRGIGMAHVDGGLFFERELNWFGQSLIQTLEPRVYFLWQDFEDQSRLPRFDSSRLTFGYGQLFRDNRFSGIDRIGDARQVSAGVTSKFLSATNGREYFRFSLGEIFYFLDRRVTLNDRTTPDERHGTSAMVAEVSAALAGSWQVYGNMVWDSHDNQIEEGGAGIRFRSDNRHIFNVGFKKNSMVDDIEQTDVSLYWPIADSFAILGRWNYDLVSGRTIEGFGGIEYEDCCLQVRLLARRFLDSRTHDFAKIEGDEGIFVQIVFKGLAGFGTKVESVLERGVRGYRSPSQQEYLSNY